MIWLQRLRPWLNALLFLLLLLPVARWGWSLYLPKKVAAVSSEQWAPPPVNKTARIDINAILHTQLFGSPPLDGELPVTTLPLKLQGVIATHTKADAVAIFAGTDPKLRAVLVGQELQPGVSLRQVFKNYAVISNNGRNERVNLDIASAQSPNSPPGFGRGGNLPPSINVSMVSTGQEVPVQTPVGQMVIQPAGPDQVVQPPPSMPAFPVPQGLRVPNVPSPYNNHQ